MPSTLFFPLDRIQPSQIFSQYSEWIYFLLVSVFFVSISGITLRRHFDKPYVKPLIVAVGLMMTIGVFRFKGILIAVFEGWGILGTILLVFVAATIPYGLCRGFGLTAGKAFYLTYILFYILSWVQFPQVHYAFAEKNLGFVNLGLLILFIVCLFRLVKFRKFSTPKHYDTKGSEPRQAEIDREIEVEVDEKKVLKSNVKNLNKIETRTLADIGEALAEIQKTVETHRNGLSREDRLKIARILESISKKEAVFVNVLERIRNFFKQIKIKDVKQMKELEERVAMAEGKEKQILKVEIAGEQEKLRIEKVIDEFESRLRNGLISFNEQLGLSVQHLKSSPYPYDVKPFLTKARVVLKDIFEISKETETLEKKLTKLVKMEKTLMNKEKESI